ncbi:MAG: hypothetical protein NVS4B9_40350 [Ktedonobacteraceae bacterium]
MTSHSSSVFGEIALIAGYLRKHGVPAKMSARVRFARRRFGCYEVIDFLALLFGYDVDPQIRGKISLPRSGPSGWVADSRPIAPSDQVPGRSPPF